jgi:putative ABC transport system permease protein
MIRIAMAMLFRDKAKFFGIIMGVTLASLVITQQGAIFTGLMARTFAAISDMGDPDVWVMDPKVQFIDDIKPLQDTSLYRVRGIEGVAFAAPLYKGLIRARLDNGEFQNCIVIGLDDATLTGGPPSMLSGRVEDLRQADAVIVDEIGAREKLGKPGPDPKSKPTPLGVGDTMELNDLRGVVVGVSRNTRTFQSQPIIYTTYSRAKAYAPRERKLLSFILVKTAAGQDPSDVARRITKVTGLAAYTRDQFKANTVMYFIKNTGIPINFGIAVSLGFIIGTVITGFMFFSFTLDNLRYFGTLKAMGADDGRLMRMIVLQAVVVGAIGFGIGVGLASLFGRFARHSPLAFMLPWQLLFFSGAAVMIICTLSAMLSMRKVIKLEPAMVFKG